MLLNKLNLPVAGRLVNVFSQLFPFIYIGIKKQTNLEEKPPPPYTHKITHFKYRNVKFCTSKKNTKDEDWTEKG